MRSNKLKRSDLSMMNYIDNEVEKRLNIAVENLRTQNEVIGRERSLPVKIAVSAWTFILIVVGVLGYFIGPDVIKGWIRENGGTIKWV